MMNERFIQLIGLSVSSLPTRIAHNLPKEAEFDLLVEIGVGHMKVDARHLAPEDPTILHAELGFRESEPGVAGGCGVPEEVRHDGLVRACLLAQVAQHVLEHPVGPCSYLLVLENLTHSWASGSFLNG